jgi:hypothetical protein
MNGKNDPVCRGCSVLYALGGAAATARARRRARGSVRAMVPDLVVMCAPDVASY